MLYPDTHDYSWASMFHFQPGEFVHTTGDTHVYSNHIEPLQEQVRGKHPVHLQNTFLNAVYWKASMIEKLENLLEIKKKFVFAISS